MDLKILILLFLTIKSARCSIVHGEVDQESIHMSKYCPKQKYCGEGTHVVCMYYDQDQEFGHRCGNPVKIEMTQAIIQSILANVNDIRGKVATGTEKGKDDEVLPRAYGLMKLEWDKELAFLAQVLANQCLGGREDNCRSTDRFPNPSQSIAVIRFKYPNWEYLQPNNTEKGMNEGKILFAFDKFLKTTHALKRTVTKDVIMKCPPYQDLPNVNLKYYLNLVRGGATHIGCGVSAYSRYKMDGDNESMQNNVQIVCNISDAPKIKQSVYKVIPPTAGLGYSKRCGCPRGFKESRSCLCERDLKYQWKGLKHQLLEHVAEQYKGIKNRLHEEENDEEKDDDLMTLAGQSNHPIIHDSTENKDFSEIDSPHSNSHNVFEGNGKAQNRGKEKNMKNFDDEIFRLKNAIAPKTNDINTRQPRERVIAFTSNKKIKAQVDKLKSKLINPADAFEELIFNVESYAGKEETTENAVDLVQHQHPKHVNNEKPPNLEPQNNDHDSKHNRLLSILNSLEHEVNNIKFDNDLHKMFESKMRKIYDKGLKKVKEIPIPRTLDKELDEEELHELRTYLENDNNESVQDEITTLREMIHKFSREKPKDHVVNYAENENNPDENYNYMDQQFDEFHDVNNMDTLYDDMLRKTADHNVQFLDIMNGKHSTRRRKNNKNNFHKHSKIRNQQTLDNDIERQAISSKADQNFNNYDETIYERQGRHADRNIIDESLQRTSFDTRIPFERPFSRRNENDDLHRRLMRRPNLLSTLKLSRNQARQAIYPGGRDTIMY